MSELFALRHNIATQSYNPNGVTIVGATDRSPFMPLGAKEALNKLIPFMVRQAHHERTQQLTVHPELVEGFNQRFTKVARKYQIRQIFLG